MQKDTLKKSKTLYTILLFLIINFCANFVLVEATSVNSINSSKEKNTSVGWYYESLDETKNINAYNGFANEYLQKISEVSGLKFQYENLTLKKSLKLLEEGKIDLVPGVLYTPERARKYTYIRPPMSICNVSVFAKSNFRENNLGKKVLVGDKLMFKGKTIGAIDTLKGYCRNTLKKEKFNISDTKFKYYSNFKDLKEALVTSKIDYVIAVTPVLDMENISEILKLKQSYLYLVINRDNEKLNEKINFALLNISKENKYFSEQLFYKHISLKRQIDFLTPKERAALEKIDKLTFYVRGNKNAMYENDSKASLGGYYSDYLKKIAKILDKDYQVIPVNKAQFAKSDVPGFFCGVNLNNGELLKNEKAVYANYVTNLISSPTRYSEKIICVRKGVTKLESDAVYASSNEVVINKYRLLGNKVVFAKKSVDALKLLEDGKVDAAIVDIVMTKYVNSSSKYNNLEILDFEEPVLQVMLGVKGVEPDLFSAVNRAVILLPERDSRAYTFDKNREIVYKPSIWEMITNYSQIVVCLWIIVLIVCVLFITVLINKNSKINKLVEKADTANHIKYDFLSRMSHEMRTPLNAIISYAKFGLSENWSLKDKEYFKKIKYSSEILLGLMKDSLELENIKLGVEEATTIIEAKDVVKKIESIIRPQAEKKNIKFNVEIEFVGNLKKEELYLKVNEIALQQIVLNLLTNAIKYTKPGGEVTWKKKVTLILNDKVFIEYEIKDNGVGMSEEFQKHMFEEFTIEENELSATEVGTGLGLALCKKMVDKTKGSLTCESKLGVGTTFKFATTQNLASEKEIENYKKENASVNMSEEKLEKDSVVSHGAKCLKILICEDILINKNIVEKILTSEGMKVDWAINGKIGVEMAEKNSYNLIIMDIRMPVMDGLTAAKLIRAKDTKIPIIALSANIYASDIEKSLKAGMNAHLGKPINKKELIDTIYRLTNIS